MEKEKIIVLQMGADIRIPSNGIITVMKMICYSKELLNKFDIQTVFFFFPHLSKSRKLLGALKAIPAFFRVIPSVHIVHIHHSTGFSFFMTMFFVFLSAFLKKKIILHNHGADFKEFYAAQKPLIKSIMRRTFERVSAVITLSESWKKWHRQNLGDKAQWIVMQNPTPLKQPSAPNPTKLKALTVLYMSCLEQRKGIYDLIDIIPGVVKEFPEVTFAFAGDGDVGLVTEKMEEKRLMKNIKVNGWVDKKQKIDILKSADIFVLPSYNEGLPMALLEAMSFGIPCIATAVGGIPELIRDGENGILIIPGNKSQLCEAILSLAYNRELREKISIAAFNTIKESYSLDQYISRLTSLYIKLADDGTTIRMRN